MILLWDLTRLDDDPREIGKVGEEIQSIVFSPDSKRIATGGTVGVIRLWNIEDLQSENISIGSVGREINGLVFSKDGESLISADEGGNVIIWNLGDNGDSSRPLNTGTRIGFTSLAISHEKQLLSASTQQEIIVWDLEDLEADPIRLDPDTFRILSIAFSPVGDYLASASYREVQLWDINNLDSPPIRYVGHDFSVNSVSFSADGNKFASAGDDRTIRLWDVGKPDIPPEILYSDDIVFSIAYSPDGTAIASGSLGEVRLWKLSQLQLDSIVLDAHNDVVFSIDFSPNNDFLVSSSHEEIGIWHLDELDGFTVDHDRKGSIRRVSVSPDGDQIAFSSEWGGSGLQKTSDSSERIIGESGFSITYSDNQDFVAMSTIGGNIWLQDINLPNTEAIFVGGHGSKVYDIAFSSDDSFLATAGQNQSIKLWDISETRGNVSPLSANLDNHINAIYSVAFSPNGQYLASGGADQTIRIWDLNQVWRDQDDNNYEPITIYGHDSAVHSVVFSPDNSTLISGGVDQKILLWDFQDLINESDIDPVTLTAPGVWAVDISPDGKWIAAGSNDRRIRLWRSLQSLIEISCERTTRNFTIEEWEQFLTDIPYSKTCEQHPVHCSVPLESWPEEHLEERNACQIEE